MGLQNETSQVENGGFDNVTRSRPVRSQREEFLLSLQKKTPEKRDNAIISKKSDAVPGALTDVHKDKKAENDALQVSNIENDNLNILNKHDQAVRVPHIKSIVPKVSNIEMETSSQSDALKFLEEVETQSEFEKLENDESSQNFTPSIKLIKSSSLDETQQTTSQEQQHNKISKDASKLSISNDLETYEDLFVNPPNDVSNKMSPKLHVPDLSSNIIPFEDAKEESDFSLSDDNDDEDCVIESKTINEIDQFTLKTLQNLKSTQIKVNIPRLSPNMHKYHQKLLNDYLNQKLKVSAPDFDDQDQDKSLNEEMKLTITGASKQSSSLLYRILATLKTRFSSSNELLSLSNIDENFNCYDSRKEISKKYTKNCKIKTISQSVEVDFCRLFKNDQDDVNDDFSSDTSDQDSDFETNVKDFSKLDSKFASDSITCIKRLKMETSSTVGPSSKILNILFKNILLEETNMRVLQATVDYLNRYLFLHCNFSIDPNSCYETILSALRNLKDEKLFRSFSIGNAQELVLCVEFWKEIIEKVIQNSQFTKMNFHSTELDEISGSQSAGKR